MYPRHLIEYISQVPLENTNVLLRMQIKLENSLPQISLFCDTYSLFRNFTKDKTFWYSIVST